MLELLLGDISLLVLHEEFLDAKSYLYCVFVVHFYQSEDLAHEEAREDIKVLLQVNLHLHEIVLRIVLLFHVAEWTVVKETIACVRSALVHTLTY